MQIQNKALANVTLRCRSGENVTGDALGVFEMSDEDADVILGTPGWEIYKAPPAVKPLRVRLQEQADQELEEARKAEQRRDEVAAAELEQERLEQERLERERLALAQTQPPSNPPPGLPAMPPPPPTLVGGVPVAPGVPPAVTDLDDAEETEEIDLDALNKEQLLDLAAKYGVTVDKRWGEPRLREELGKSILEE